MDMLEGDNEVNRKASNMHYSEQNFPRASADQVPTRGSCQYMTKDPQRKCKTWHTAGGIPLGEPPRREKYAWGMFGVIRVMVVREGVTNVDAVEDKRARGPVAPLTPVR